MYIAYTIMIIMSAISKFSKRVDCWNRITRSHTNDNETILGPSDPHIDLMRISEEAKVVPEPSAVWLHQIMIPDLLHRLRPDCGQDHVSIFISYESKGKENSNDD